LSNLISQNKYDHPQNENIFYDLFLVDYNGDLIDVPVMITNVQSQSGDTPNYSGNEANWILTRRFFIYDTLSGIKNSEYDVEGAVPDVIRYAKNI